MRVLTAVMTHLDAERVHAQMEYLRRLAPGASFVVCHGGAREEFERLDEPGALFIDDPTLRGRDQDHSHNAVMNAVYETYVRDDADVDLVYFIEYDHLILQGDFEERLSALASASPAGLFAKHASRRNDTNWPHFTRFRHDTPFNDFIDRISCRDDRDARWGALGTGMLLRRDALAAFNALGDIPHAYVEMVVPTVIYHLGFEVVNVDAVSDLYAAVRWRPPYTADEAIALAAAGRVFVHPFKQLDELPAIERAARPASARELEYR